MKKNFKRSIFIFHRDLRLEDNTALNQAREQSEDVIPVFIVDTVQVGDLNAYRSVNAIQFMIESLEDLADQLQMQGGKLYLFYGKTDEIIESILKNYAIDAVFSNADYTPFAQERDKKLACITTEKYKRTWLQYHDALLMYPGQILKDNGQPYSMFTPFFKKALTYTIPEVQKLASGNFYKGTLSEAYSLTLLKTLLPIKNPHIFEHGGTKVAKAMLKKSAGWYLYEKNRDVPALHTTGLSAHNKFGTVSIRQVYDVCVKTSPILARQLYWRDFFTHLVYHFPYVFKGAFNKKYDAISWKKNNLWFERWCNGTTGFPIVDAGMRQLNETGYMHNRVRMIVASFLTKDLHISWQMGERYFAQKLVDYDPCVNNGSWQWAASTGADAQPYFRIFNPWLQQKKFDPQATYIKTWVPELKNFSVKTIHAWYKQSEPSSTYPAPMVEHAVQSAYAKALFKNL